MYILNTTNEKYKRFLKNGFLFFKRDYVKGINDNGEEDDILIFRNCDDDSDFRINPETVNWNFYNSRSLSHILCYVGDLVSSEAKSDNVSFSINQIDLRSDSNCWIYLINNFLYRCEDSYDNFPYIYLVWSLNYCIWNESIVIDTIKKYDKKVIPYILKALSQISKSLSYNSQRKIRHICAYFAYEYNVYAPEIIYKPLKKIFNSDKSVLDKNLFTLVKYFFYIKEAQEQTELDFSETINNPLKRINDWLNSVDYTMDYEILPSVFPILGEKIQHNIIRRYFYDIKNKKTEFDHDLIKKLKESHESKFARYRYCLYSPNEPYSISVPLLCDSLLTLISTKGKVFQTFNGILDLAIHTCDVRQPKIDLRLHNFLPKCHGGAICNDNFTGFINFVIGYKLKSKWDNPSFLQSVILDILRRNGYNKSYAACSVTHKEISEKQLRLCNKKPLNCSITLQYKDVWIVNKSNYNNIQIFLKETPKVVDGWNYEITKSELSEAIFCSEIKKILDRLTKSDNEVYIINNDENNEVKQLLNYFLEPSTLRIYPKENVIVDEHIDLFNLEKNRDTPFGKEVNKDALEEEKKIVHERVVTSLEKELNAHINEDKYFEVPYSNTIFNKLRNIFYCHPSAYTKYQNINSFLRKRNNKYPMFCAPRISETSNPALNLPYTWCRGKECFQNELSKEVLENNSNWEEYSLLHFSEILGYPMVTHQGNLYETSTMISSFISLCNKVIKTFSRLQCRKCKHLIFPDKGTDFNKFNHFSCVNPGCEEYRKVIYLNYCFKCKKGLIDSRDSAQCPNGWYICPNCSSCCDDAQYERQAQKYILSHRPVPEHIRAKLGHGHNDKGIFFCHICGTQLENTKNEHGENALYCPECKSFINEL